MIGRMSRRNVQLALQADVLTHAAQARRLALLVMTPLYPSFEKRINDAFERVRKTQVDPWAFLNTGHSMQVKKLDGQSISYQGVGFEGSPRYVFWGRYIEPFLEEIAIQHISAAVKEAKEREVDARELLPEIQSLLLAGCSRVFARMAEVDRNLLGKGLPDKVRLRPVIQEYEAMRQFIERHVQAELQMWKPRRPYEIWYEKNKFFVWVLGVVITVAGLAVKFL